LASRSARLFQQPQWSDSQRAVSSTAIGGDDRFVRGGGFWAEPAVWDASRRNLSSLGKLDAGEANSAPALAEGDV
jgi:hypothetical protein